MCEFLFWCSILYRNNVLKNNSLFVLLGGCYYA
nr:MAG TPA: hypothetical protein [Caudoviricetes sp.]